MRSSSHVPASIAAPGSTMPSRERRPARCPTKGTLRTRAASRSTRGRRRRRRSCRGRAARVSLASCAVSHVTIGIQSATWVRAWLVTVAVRRTRRVLARRRRRMMFAFWSVDFAPRASDPRDRAAVDELYDVLSRVTADLRIPWVLHRIEHLSLPETAAACEVSLATVKRRIADAEERIERRLGSSVRCGPNAPADADATEAGGGSGRGDDHEHASRRDDRGCARARCVVGPDALGACSRR